LVISKQTAAGLEALRANAELPFMGMQSYDKRINDASQSKKLSQP